MPARKRSTINTNQRGNHRAKQLQCVELRYNILIPRCFSSHHSDPHQHDLAFILSISKGILFLWHRHSQLQLSRSQTPVRNHEVFTGKSLFSEQITQYGVSFCWFCLSRWREMGFTWGYLGVFLFIKAKEGALCSGIGVTANLPVVQGVPGSSGRGGVPV